MTNPIVKSYPFSFSAFVSQPHSTQKSRSYLSAFNSSAVKVTQPPFRWASLTISSPKNSMPLRPSVPHRRGSLMSPGLIGRCTAGAVQVFNRNQSPLSRNPHVPSMFPIGLVPWTTFRKFSNMRFLLTQKQGKQVGHLCSILPARMGQKRIRNTDQYMLLKYVLKELLNTIIS